MSLRLVGSKPLLIGVLDLQGGVHEHLEHLERLGVACKRVKQAEDFKDLAGLIIPGGESSCIARLLNIFGIKDVLLQAHQNGMKIWGTCAGAILLARDVVGETSCLNLINIRVERNGFGSQLDSFVSEAIIPEVSRKPIPLTFIRAPKILDASNDVRVLLKIDDYIAAAENEKILVTVFHPELTGNLAFHRYFALKCGLNPAMDTNDDIDPQWNNSSWTKYAGII
ncbi:MAG: pyridoxal 5'-phosphate synthase glutaminase subunit PdxT [Smithella sp.]|nr:pyridoxal 5'-phosphate synthase glutaminase subunit PdxT [Smithella sp.]MDM7986200.1 pyridoxal 5'-phosphate synthase glutaminase subunit PdxT [Smithella sp.]HOU51858.1 pyridoxal 5'-phosphate synthase glutaminase subunit PdxT [Smithella sp.]HQG66049.1 pyridoxal 5'-phosphate synthase glutaminase subunit PdxT [Smithella sp.]HQH17892.1 pyridoxal 5'-phosphate synthase glutaminase subunit PdxT [Smithella sp.]